ncbi:MAG TPA: DUF167 domain-containing protein [Chloroflexota bacterium]|jgi:uncharacterized protein (TIGR00251 family)|nr:DUF167 domain-containing protein [Chloroflexota bacterium]
MPRLSVRVQPGASRDELRLEDGVLRVRLSTPAVEGKANKRLIVVLAKRLGVSKSAVRIVRGETARDKVLEIGGLDAQELARRLESG